MRKNWDEFLDETLISEAASFAGNNHSTIIAPSTQRKYESAESQFHSIMNICPWRKGLNVIDAGPTVQDMKFFIRILCLMIKQENTVIRARTLRSKAWIILS